jgi:hypothetical protein
LSAALEQALARHFGAPRRLHRLRRRVSAYSSSCTIENLEVELDRGQKLRLVFKNLSPAALLEGAKRVRPGFLYEPQREILTYERILDPQRLGSAVCYGSVSSVEQERYWLFLERVTGPLLWQVGRMEAWEQAARWLARLHSEFDAADFAMHLAPSPQPSPPMGERVAAGQGRGCARVTRSVSRSAGTMELPKGGERFAHLVRHDEEFYGTWLGRAEEFLRQRRARASPEIRRRFRRLAGRYDRLVARLMELPRTVVHGEFYPSNIIVGGTAEARRICPVDWELAASAPGLIDLAALTAGGWSPEARAKMIAAYRDALEPRKHRTPSLGDLVEAVACCQLHGCVQWLGWAADWSPPDEHAQNWLQEAFRLADKLGL